MPLDKDELDIRERPPRYNSPTKLLRDTPDKAYTFEEIDARTRFPVTRIGLLLYLEAIRSGPRHPRIGHTRTEGKDYYYWKGAEQPGDQE